MGRTDELTLVHSSAADAAAGRPRVVVVEGPAGIGKTAFLRRVTGGLAGLHIVRASADELAGDEPMWLLGQLVPGVRAVTAPFAAALALLDDLARRQSSGPVALVVEDLHWADDRSRRALLTALRRLDGDRVLALISTRPQLWADDPAWESLADDPVLGRRIQLGALSAAEINDLADRLGIALGPNAARRLQRHTAGQALHVRTLLRELTTDQLNAFGALPAPRTLAQTTATRVSALPDDSVRLLRSLAVLGRPTPLAALGRVAGIADPTAALDAALGSSFVSRPLDSGEVRYVHPLYATAVYDDIPPLLRRELHLAAAEVDVRAALVHRIAAADRVDESLAVELEDGAATADPATAARYLVAAAEVSDTAEGAARRVVAAARTLYEAGELAALVRMTGRLEACPPTAERDLLLGRSSWQRGDLAAAESLLRDSAAEGHAGSASAWRELGALYAFSGRGPDAVAAGRAVLALPGVSAEDEDAAWRVIAAGVNQSEGGMAGLAVLDSRYGAVPPDELDAQVQWSYAVCENCAGRPAAALDWFRRLIPRAHRADLAGNLAHIHMLRAQCHYRVGDWDEALVHAHTAIDLANDEGQRWVLGHVNAVAGWIHAGRGQWEIAQRRLDQARAATAQVSISAATILTDVAWSLLARAKGDHEQVVTLLTPIAARQGPPSSSNLAYWPALVHALIDLGRLDEAAASLDAMTAAAAVRRLDFRTYVHTCRARLAAAAGDAQAAAADFQEAVAAVETQTDRLEQVVLHHHYGRHLRSLGRRREANTQLARARALADSLGAVPYLEAVDVDLRLSEPPSQTRDDPLAALTARERDVVTLVVGGSTNKEVAASLYVSVKAVEYHVGNVYAKLQINSRRQLKELVGSTHEA